MKAIAALFDVIPGWVYAALIAALTLGNCGMHERMLLAETGKAKTEKTLAEERGAHQKALAEQTALVLKKTNELRDMRAAQEKRDGEAQATIAQLGKDLRRRSRAAGGPGLRDPFATACGGQPAAGSGPAAGAGGADAAQAGGVLSAQLEGLLLRLAAEADELNVAYASCRQDDMDLRVILKQLSPPISPAPQVPSP